MTIKNILDFAKSKNACQEAVEWLHTQPDPETAWSNCGRPDWMIWYARRRGTDVKVLVRIACDCARAALRFVPEGEDRPRLAIETIERWLAGEATIAEVRSARTASASAAYAASAVDAYAVASAAAAAYAVDAVASAVDAYAVASAAAATYAVDAVASAVDAYAVAARRQANIQICNIIRTHIRYEDIAL